MSGKMVINNHSVVHSKIIPVCERYHLIESPRLECSDDEEPVCSMPCGWNSVRNPVEFSRES